METHEELTPEQARAALDQVGTGRSAAGRRVTTPWWYHPLLGAVLAVLLGSFSLRGTVFGIVLVLALAAEMALFALYRRLTGMWVNTLLVPEMQRVTVVATVVVLLLFSGAVLLEELGVRGAAAAAGVVLGTAYVVYWRWVERQLTRLWSA